MKKIMLLLIAVYLLQATIAQQPQFINNPFPKTISVSGSAEMEIVPDEIYVNIQLTEYQKRGDSKKDIEIIKTQFLESCKAANIPDSVISIVSYSGYNNYFNYRKRKNTDLFASITYQVKFKTTDMMNALVEKLDDNATQNFQIVLTSHSNVIEFRKQLKIKAIQAAKEKGSYLAEAIGEKLGETITINEPAESQPDLYRNMSNGVYENVMFSQFRAMPSDDENEVEFKKMKLWFEVNVVFALK